MSQPSSPGRLPDWEAFYSNYRSPGYVPGFEITSKLGGGMFGLVFKAVRQSIGKDYAIKFLRVDDGEVQRAVLLELEQVQYFAQIDHPNLVSIEDRGEVDGIPYLVMAYAGAETLRDLLPGDDRIRPVLVHYFEQACRGVAALHEKSLVHFDLKPANVFLKAGVARVGDYGLSKLVSHGRGSLSMGRGTPYYMAPEMLQRRGDHRSDVYSLGVMLFEVLTGQLPFRGDSEWEVLRQHEKGVLRFPPGVGARDRAVVERCMQKDPAMRFQSVHDLIAALHAGETLARVSVADEVFEAAAAVAAVGASAPAPQPPPLPAAGRAAPRAAPVAKTARRRGTLVRPLLMAAVFAGALAAFVHQKTTAAVRAAERQANVIAPRSSVRIVTSAGKTAVETDGDVRDEIHRLAAAIERAGRRRARIDLHPIDEARVSMPAALPLYRDELRRVADVRDVSPLVRAQLEMLGFPMVVAAVAWLQDQDYTGQEACAAAARVLAFLQSATAVDGLCVDPPLAAPDAATQKRFYAAADAWRRLVEQYCRDDDGFRAMLTATGKAETGPGGLRRKN